MNENNIEGKKLTKYLSTLNVWALAFGCSVGWGAFVMPGTTFLPIAGPLGTAIGLFLGALVMLIIGMNYHYMMNHYPDCGGTFTYTKKIFGYDHGFLSAWFIVLVYVAIIWANATALAIICRRLFGDLFQVGFHYQIASYDVYFGEIVISVIALFIVGIICMYRKILAVNLQTLMSIIFVISVSICFVHAFNNNIGGMKTFEPLFAANGDHAAQIFSIVALAPWAFIGFESISHSTEEFNFSTRKSFLIMTTAVLTGFLVYTLLSELAVLGSSPDYYNWQSYIEDLEYCQGLKSLPTVFAALNSMGNIGVVLLTVAIFCAIMTGIIGNCIAASRLIYSMSNDNLLPKWFGELNSSGIPKNAILSIITVSMLIPLLGRTTIGWIVDMTSVCAVIVYGYTSAAAYVTAKKESDTKIQIVGISGFILSALFGLFLLVPNLLSISTMAAESYLIIVIWSVLGFVFFRAMFKHDDEHKFGKSVVVWIVMLFLIFFGSILWARQASNRSMEEVVDNISNYYTEEIEKHGIQRQRYRKKDDQAFLENTMETVRNSIFEHSVIQMFLILISLSIMFNIYSLMRKREKQAESEKINALESSKAKTIFLSNMSHDIRTPMNAIIGYINLAQRKGVSEAEIQDFLKKIETSSKHLLNLINDVLEMSRIESGKMELDPINTNLVKAIEEVHDMFATQMQTKDITFKVDTSNVQDRFVICDKNRLDRVLLNLLSNAYKFTPAGGNISLTLSQLNNNNVEDSSDDNFREYELRVKDSGIGMTPEFAAKVFEAFERERTSTVSGIQGTGLGMAITKSIIDLMNGEIKVITAPGKGTEFVINVKFELGEEIIEETEVKVEKIEEVEKSETSETTEAPKKLLLVDDIEVNREIAVMILTQAGFIVDTAVNGKDAVDKVAGSKVGDYDAVLMDIQMPVMNGYEAAQAIRKLENPELANIPIIAMTANAFGEDIQNAKDAGMNDHIAKPLDVPKMMETLKKNIK